MENSTAKDYKEKFFDDNPSFVESKSNNESVTIGEFQDIDELEDEIWIMQCPKGASLTQIQGQKLKLPGRTSVQDMEAVSVEFTDAVTKSFGYCNRKSKFALRLLPIHGNIILRNRLKANGPVTEREIEEISTESGRMTMPNGIKVRHPLLGVQYQQKINVDKTITERLKEADKQSARILRDTLFHNIKKSSKKTSKANAIEISDEDGSLVSPKKIKKKAKKRKSSESSNMSKIPRNDYIEIF